MFISSLDERALIARIRARVPSTHSDLLIGIGDDGAIVRPARNRVEVVTTDMMIEGVHFRREWSSPHDIGAKAIAVNVSDLGAMGAEPRMATLSLALPDTLLLADFDALIDGVSDAAAAARLVIAGGNLTRSPGPLVVDVTAIGAVHPRKALRRDAACAGDALWVTGSLGAGVAGLRWLERHGLPAESSPAWRAVRRACRPEPPLKAGVALSRTGASRAAIDLSDGLGDGLRRLAEASGCGITVDADALPLEASTRTVFENLGLDPVAEALAGGDDYELLFTVSPRNRGRFRAARAVLGTPVTRIGVVTSGNALLVTAQGGQVALPAGFDHFRSV
ncbi:MAG: thiamine-phosphate kinase [Acidobacteriota bacterium]|nr:thiamine-phosphate kinase [Acidobacteriota bacterium]